MTCDIFAVLELVILAFNFLLQASQRPGEIEWKMQNNEIIKPAKYFSELEKSILLALVEKYKYVLECKKSDARTIALKQRTWQALAHEYNSQPSVSLRDFKQLKKCWENIKARTKKIMAHERREKVKRSGSPLLSTHVLDKEKIGSMLPEQLYFLQSPPEEEPEYHQDAATQGTPRTHTACYTGWSSLGLNCKMVTSEETVKMLVSGWGVA